jgi:hypothetical protein
MWVHVQVCVCLCAIVFGLCKSYVGICSSVCMSVCERVCVCVYVRERGSVKKKSLCLGRAPVVELRGSPE